VSPGLSTIVAVAAATSTVVPPDGSVQLSEVNVFARPAAVASTSRYVPSASPEIVLELPDARSLNACPTPEYDHATRAGAGSVCKRTTIEPAPAAPAAATPMPRPTARTQRENRTRPPLARRQKRNQAPVAWRSCGGCGSRIASRHVPEYPRSPQLRSARDLGRGAFRGAAVRAQGQRHEQAVAGQRGGVRPCRARDRAPHAASPRGARHDRGAEGPRGRGGAPPRPRRRA